MNAIKFFKTDIIRCKNQFKVWAIFLFVAASVGIGSDQGGEWCIFYLMFGSIIFASAPFALENVSDSGFFSMLPGRKKDRVIGRFLYSWINVLLGMIFGWCIAYGACISKGGDFKTNIIIGGCLAGVCLIIVSIQNIIYYAVGKGGNQQVMALLRIIPAFVIFISGSIAAKVLSYTDNLKEIVLWVVAHPLQFTIIVFVAGFLLSVGCLGIALKITKKKDFI